MMNFTLKSAAMAASYLVLLGMTPAKAGADAVRAEAYFNAISGGNADTIASFYADDAEFHWIGGPLAGKYKGKDKIKGVWEKFATAAGKINHKVLELSESANGKTSTVTARVMFKADSEVPVKFIMVYKNGKIASEVWQVDRAYTAEAKAEPKAGEAKPETAPVEAPSATSEQPQREAVITPPADGPATPETKLGNDSQGQSTPAPQAAAPVSEAPAAAEKQAGTAPESAPANDAKPSGEPKPKYAREKKSVNAEKYNDNGYEKKTYRRKKAYYGYDGYDHDHGYGHGGYGWYGGYGHGYGGYGRGYGRY
jgi:ketosteroid isomerase-like protein